MLRGSKNETLEKAFRRHQNPVAVQKNSPKFKSAASATAVPNTIVVVPNCYGLLGLTAEATFVRLLTEPNRLRHLERATLLELSLIHI